MAIDGHDDPRATREFEADVVILHHSTTVAPGYQPVIHCGVVRQAAAILSMSGTESGMEALRTGQTATVRFRFMVRKGRQAVRGVVLFSVRLWFPSVAASQQESTSPCLLRRLEYVWRSVRVGEHFSEFDVKGWASRSPCGGSTPSVLWPAFFTV